MRKKIIGNHIIKVFITKDDLKQNGLTALDLLGDHNQIEAFFYKILGEVDTQHIFRRHEPLTFRVLPNQTGLNIIISRHRRPKNFKEPQKMAENPKPKSVTKRVIELDNFENFIQISRLLKLKHVISTLYRYKNKYYLELNFNYNLIRSQLGQIKNCMSMVYEYGRLTNVTPDKLNSDGKLIMKDHALEQCRHYFH